MREGFELILVAVFASVTADVFPSYEDARERLVHATHQSTAIADPNRRINLTCLISFNTAPHRYIAVHPIL